MNPLDLKLFKNAIPYLSSPEFLETHKLLSNPDFLALHNAGIKAPKALISQSVDIPPEALIAESTAISALGGMNIAHINSLLSQLNQIPDENFKVIKRTVAKNRSKIRDAAKDNREAVSDMFKQACESSSYEALVISEDIAQLVASIDDSLKLPELNKEQKIHIDKSNSSTYIGVISIVITLLTFIFMVYQSWSSTRLSERQHAELMQEERKQTEYLKQIAENTASTNSTGQPSEEPPKNKVQ